MSCSALTHSGDARAGDHPKGKAQAGGHGHDHDCLAIALDLVALPCGTRLQGAAVAGAVGAGRKKVDGGVKLDFNETKVGS